MGLIIAVVTLILALVISRPPVAVSGSSDSNLRTVSASYTPHAPIFIFGDANFTAANGVVAGDGSSGNPYVISGWNITDRWSASDGIVVINTTAHLVIRNVLINASYRDVEPEMPTGVGLLNVSHVVVEQVTVLGNAYGFAVGSGWGRDSSNVTLLDNRAMGNWVGVSVGSSDDVLVQGNTLSGSDASNPSMGWSGIRVGGCGVPLCPARRVLIVENEVMNNENGISVVTSSSVVVYHNNFLNNTNPASTDAPNYTWDNGYPSGGNFWSNYTGVDHCSGPQQNECNGSDGVGDTPYTFPVGGVDRYPLMEPYPGAGSSSLPPAPTGGAAGAAEGVLAVGILALLAGSVFLVVVVAVGRMMRRALPPAAQQPKHPPPPPELPR